MTRGRRPPRWTRPAGSRCTHPRAAAARRHHALACGIAVAAAACLPCGLHAQSASLNGTLALGSELVDRGQAITAATPVLQGAASWNFAQGWSVGVSASTEVRSAGQLVEAIAQVTRYWQVADDWQLQASLLYYKYPGSARSGALDRTEAGIHWTYRDVLTAGVSGIYVAGVHNHGPRAAFDLGLHWPLAPRLYFAAGLGIAEPAVATYYDDNYTRPTGYARTGFHAYGQVGLLWSSGAWQVELDRLFTDGATRDRWRDLGTSPWVATIAWSF